MNDNFKYSVIGNNTPENREWLKKIGAKFANSMTLDSNYLYVYTAFNGEYSYYSVRHQQAPIHVVNCIGNPQLFRAVTAMRDDSDMWQYFTNGVKLILFDGDDFNEFYIKMNYYRKATLEELKEHFQ